VLVRAVAHHRADLCQAEFLMGCVAAVQTSATRAQTSTPRGQISATRRGFERPIAETLETETLLADSAE